MNEAAHGYLFTLTINDEKNKDIEILLPLGFGIIYALKGNSTKQKS